LYAFVLGKPCIRVQRVVIHRNHAEQVIICFGDCLAGPMFVDITYFEVFETAPEGSVKSTHSQSAPLLNARGLEPILLQRVAVEW
jgi:hypothetical protein